MVDQREEEIAIYDLITQKVGIIGLVLFSIVVIVLGIALPIAMVSVGVIYMEDCPVERMIPIYLIVYGVLIMLNVTITAHMGAPDEKDTGCSSALGLGLSVFSMAWFIAGNVFVFSNFQTVNTEDKTSLHYCNVICYYFAFSSIMMIYAIMFISVTVAVCVACKKE